MKTEYRNYNQYEEDSSNGSMVLAAVLTAAAFGFIAAVLYAPMSGKDTKAKITGFLGEKKAAATGQWEGVKSKAKEVADTAKDKFSSVTGQAKNKMNTYADQADEIANESESKFKGYY